MIITPDPANQIEDVPIVKLMELTGCARSTISKDHIDAVLKKNKVYRYEHNQ